MVVDGVCTRIWSWRNVGTLRWCCKTHEVTSVCVCVVLHVVAFIGSNISSGLYPPACQVPKVNVVVKPVSDTEMDSSIISHRPSMSGSKYPMKERPQTRLHTLSCIVSSVRSDDRWIFCPEKLVCWAL
jgi:hypothetical protein